jgi:predicted flap endonuclease-1-like 5' DNA nuclease
MSACRLVLDSVCRSNHHRIAVLALTHLAGETGEAWRNVFLKHHKRYLEGAKAPDELFRDFRNHVLHVRDNDWGGAREAAREWYRRTVRALKEQDWAHAAWCAGVMSHYAVDPIQPFHTHQSEEEGVVHRALESALSRGFPELHAIIENELGWPDVPMPQGDDWLEKMIRTGAAIATKHYETVLDHYDIEAGHRRPEDGLDQELKDIFAALIGYASVMLARVLDRAIHEAAIAPPNVSLTLDSLGIVLATPGRALAKRAEYVAERRLVASQYAEFRMTGKVRETLSEDDKVVRRLHAEEVLKINLATLDSQWPRETGTKNGQGAKARIAGKKRKPAPVLTLETPAPAAPKKVEAAAPPAKKADKPQKPTPEKVAKPAKAESKPAPKAAPAAKIRAALSREASVVDAPSIGPKTAGRLNLIGVKTVGDLLELSPDDAAARIKQGHINARVIKDWQAQALLACTVPELSALGAQLLVGAGVSTVDDLASADPDFLVDAIAMFAASDEGERALRGQPVPDRDRLKFWIEAALIICENRTAA